jgi:hypothetical protein
MSETTNTRKVEMTATEICDMSVIVEVPENWTNADVESYYNHYGASGEFESSDSAWQWSECRSAGEDMENSTDTLSADSTWTPPSLLVQVITPPVLVLRKGPYDFYEDSTGYFQSVATGTNPPERGAYGSLSALMRLKGVIID